MKGEKINFFRKRNIALLVMILYFPLMMVTTRYYFGRDGMSGRFNDVHEAIRVTFATSHPGLHIGGIGFDSRLPFSGSLSAPVTRVIGNERTMVGMLEGRLHFSNFHLGNVTVDRYYNGAIFSPMPQEMANLYKEEIDPFNRLEQLGSGTMEELYISFMEPLSLEETFDLFRGSDLTISWMAVITEPIVEDNWDSYFSFFGMPGGSFDLRANWSPVDGSWSCVICYEPEPLGDVAFREAEFLDALHIMEQHPSIVERIIGLYAFHVRDAIDFVEANGVKLRGVLVTGPSTELLDLQNEPWIYHATLGQVRFINWGQ